MLIKMAVDGTHHTFSIVDGTVIFKALLFRHLTHIIGAGVVGSSGNAGGFAYAILLTRGEKYSRKEQNSGTDKAFFHNFHFKYFIMRNLRGKDTIYF